MSGPPELPSLMAASVWMPFSMVARVGELSGRLMADTMPEVMVNSRPRGFPMATTC